MVDGSAGTVGRRAHFEAQVLPHLDAAYRFARWLANAPAEADDIVQDAMLRAYRAFDSLRGADAKPRLLSIVRRCHATARGQARRRGFVPLPEERDSASAPELVADTPDPERVAVQSDQARHLARILTLLSEEHREVLVLREVEDLDYREIAVIVGVPMGTVMSRLARARAALKSAWLEDVEGRALDVR
jgi:RNA polymerase sigma-70 factor (ECF subfamily)